MTHQHFKIYVNSDLNKTHMDFAVGFNVNEQVTHDFHAQKMQSIQLNDQ